MLSRITLLFFYICLLVSWLLPVHNRPWTTAYPELMAGVALVFAALALATTRHRVHIPVATLLILLVAGIPLLQRTFGIILFNGDAILACTYILAFASSLLISYNLQINSFNTKNSEFSVQFAWALLAGSIISFGIMLHQWLELEPNQWIYTIPPATRPSANIAQPNNLSTLLGMGLAGVFLLFEKEKSSKSFSILMATLIILGIALTQSRTPWLVAVFIIIIFILKSKNITTRVKFNHVIAWTTAYAAMLWALPYLADLLYLSASSPVERIQQLHRLDLYNQFIYAVIHGPWHGYGWGQVFSAQLAIAESKQSYMPAMYAHNILLDLLIWNGPLAGGIIITASALWLFKLLADSKSKEAMFAWIGLGFFITHCMLEFPHAYTNLLIPAGFLLGILLTSNSKEKKLISIPSAATYPLIITGSILIYALWVDYIKIEKNHHKAIAEFGKDTNKKNTPNREKAKLIDHMQSYIDLIEKPVNSKFTRSEIEEITRTAERYPHFFVLIKSAQILTINDRLPEAKKALTSIGNIHSPEKLEASLRYLKITAEDNPEILKILTEFDFNKDNQLIDDSTKKPIKK